MAIAANTRPVIHFRGLLFKTANQQHLVIIVEQRLLISTLKGRRRLHLFIGRWRFLRCLALLSIHTDFLASFLLKQHRVNPREPRSQPEIMSLGGPYRMRQRLRLRRSGSSSPALCRYMLSPRTHYTPSAWRPPAPDRPGSQYRPACPGPALANV